MKCPHCGAEVPEGDLFCGECGRRVQDIEQPTVYAPIVEPGLVESAAPAPKRKFPWLIVVLVVLALCVVCGGGGAAWYFMRPTPTPTPTYTPMPTATFTPTPTPTPTATPTATPTPAVETTIYADSHAGYSIAHPVDWTIVDEDPGSSVLLAESLAVEDDLAAGDFVFCLSEGDTEDLDTLRQAFDELFMDETLELVGSESVVVGGVDGLALTLKGQPPDARAEVRLHVLLAVRKRVGYAFLFGGPADGWETRWHVFEVMIGSVSLFDAVAMPTPTPEPALPPDAKITSLQFATGVDDDDEPLGITDVFPPGVTAVYAVFDYEGFEGVTEYEVIFSLNGEEDLSNMFDLSGEDSGQRWVRRFNDDGLEPGEYECEVSVQGRPLARAGFTVLGGEVVLEDDFSDAESGWSTKDTDITKTWYEDQELHVLIKEAGWTTYSAYSSDAGDTIADFYLSVNAWLVEVPDAGGEYGVVVRRDDQDYYQFLISQSGFYKVRKHAEEEWTTLLDWVETDLVNKGTDDPNHFGIQCQGAELRFFLNHILVATLEDASYASGQIGLMAGSYKDSGGVHAVFDDLVVYELE